MANDYEARKRSKKRKSFDISPELASEGGKKNRKKRAPIRRMCKGMCYNEPSLTEEDKLWRESDPASVSEGSNSERRAAQAAITELNLCMKTEAAKKQALKAKQKQRRATQRAGHHYSTSIDLTNPEQSHTVRLDSQDGAAEQDPQHGVPACFHQYMSHSGFAEAMPVQERCWPACLQGRDVMVTAEPGSGKTLGYLLPILARLAEQGQGLETRPSEPIALILVPTRELALQIAQNCRSFHKICGLRAQVLIGGADKDRQIAGLETRPHIVIATPGRLLDMWDDNHIDLGGIAIVVLDEADKMLDLGLQPQLFRLQKLLIPKKQKYGQEQVPLVVLPKRPRPQVMMFSATATEASEKASMKWLRHAERICIGTNTASISQSIVQSIHVCAEHKKPQKLLKHLQQVKSKSEGLRNPPRVLIFANRVKTVRFLHQTVADAGLRAVMLHGERSQAEREEAMKDFRSGKAQVMVATDVAARGLHIRGLPYVVNYDFPSTLEQYVHRAGRAGRLASNGHCYSFFTRNLAPLAQPLLALLQEHGQTVDPNLVRLADAYQIALDKTRSEPNAQVFDGDVKDSPVIRLTNEDKQYEEEDMLVSLFGDGEVSEDVSQSQEGQTEQMQPKSGMKLGSKKNGHRKALPGRLRKKIAKAGQSV